MKMRLYQAGWLFTLVLVLAACAQQPRVESTEDQLAVAYGSVEALANSLTVHVKAGTMKPEEAAPYLNQLADIKHALDLATAALHGPDPQTGLEKLLAAQKLLIALQLELTKRLEASQ